MPKAVKSYKRKVREVIFCPQHLEMKTIIVIFAVLKVNPENIISKFHYYELPYFRKNRLQSE